MSIVRVRANKPPLLVLRWNTQESRKKHTHTFQMGRTSNRTLRTWRSQRMKREKKSIATAAAYTKHAPFAFFRVHTHTHRQTQSHTYALETLFFFWFIFDSILVFGFPANFDASFSFIKCFRCKCSIYSLFMCKTRHHIYGMFTARWKGMISINWFIFILIWDGFCLFHFSSYFQI